jgi:hypothetical protein
MRFAFVDEIVERIKDESIEKCSYDPATAKIVEQPQP